MLQTDYDAEWEFRHLRVAVASPKAQVKMPSSSQNHFRVETDLGAIDIRLNVKDNDGSHVESIHIQPNEGVNVEGDSMIVLRKR